MGNIEKSIYKGLPAHLKLISRDGSGKLWVVTYQPTVYLGDMTLEFNELNGVGNKSVHSLSLFNNLFRSIDKPSNLELRQL